MRRVIQRQITTIQIVSVEVTWAEETGTDAETVEETGICPSEKSPAPSRKPRRKLSTGAESSREDATVILPTLDDIVP